jgi:hypothetical protein
MKRILLLLLLTSLCTWTYGQSVFNYHKDFKTIVAKSKDSSSELFYPKLLERFNRNDSTLTNKEVLSLMIGFTENENYKPYETIQKEREVLQLIRDKNYKEALSATDSLLKTNPLNLAALMEKGFALWKLGDKNVGIHKSRYLKVLDAVLSSGNGSKANPFFVLSPIDGQTLIRYVWQGSIGTMGSGPDENGYFLDILEMKREGENPVTVNFHIQHAVSKSTFSKQIEATTKKKKK